VVLLVANEECHLVVAGIVEIWMFILSTWPVISIDSARGGGDARRGAPPRPPGNRGWREEMQRFGHTFKLA